MQIANVKQRQILPRVGNQIWVSTPQNLASERVCSRNCCSLKCKHIFGFYYKAIYSAKKKGSKRCLFLLCCVPQFSSDTAKAISRPSLLLERIFTRSTTSMTSPCFARLSALIIRVLI